MQKRKSFLMKLLVLLTVVFCTFALAFGMVGCAADGKDGANGKDGKDGVGIESVYVNEDGELIIKLTDGTEKNAGLVKGDKGDQGDAAGAFKTNCINAHEDETLLIHEVRAATCTQEQVVLKFCLDCMGYNVETVEGSIYTGVDGNHVLISWEKNENGIWEELATESITILPQTSLELAMGACPERECNYCKQPLAQHLNTTEKVVSADVNTCVNDYLTTEFCLDCKASISGIKKVDAEGHKYNTSNYVEVGYITGKDFKVKLQCTECLETAIFDAKLMKTTEENGSVLPTCKDGGYDNYKVVYNNGLAEDHVNYATASFTIKKNEQGKSNVHTFSKGELSIRATRYENINWVDDNDEALAALTAGGEDAVIRAIEGIPTVCSKDGKIAYTEVVADCSCCGHPVNFNLSGKHELDTEKAATCTVDGHIPCKVEGCPYKKVTTLAKGHEYQYVNESFKTTATKPYKTGDEGTADFKCKNCDAKLDDVAVKFVKNVPGSDCKIATYDLFETKVAYSNGLSADPKHTNYKTAVLQAKVEDPDAVKHHELSTYKLKDLIIYKAKDQNGDPLFIQTYNDNVKAAIAANDLRWLEGDAGTCAEYKEAVFVCTCCGTDVVINLMGPHNEVKDQNGEVVRKTLNATCTQFGYNYKECDVPNCLADGIIIQDYIEPVGHYFVADETAKANFIADVKAGNIDNTDIGVYTVKFVCATEGCDVDADATTVTPATINAKLKEIGKLIEGNDACHPIDRTPYTFDLTHSVVKSNGAANVENIKNENNIIYDAEGQPSHKLKVVIDGVTKELDDIYVGQVVSFAEYEDATKTPEENEAKYAIVRDVYRAGLSTKQVRWIEGIPGTCLVNSDVVFDCADCGNPIRVSLPGDCVPKADSHKDATCEKYAYSICSVCNHEIYEDAALGHDFSWTLKTPSKVIAKGANAVNTVADVTLGEYVGVCGRTGCDANPAPATVNAVGTVDIASLKKATCCDDGSIKVLWKYDNELVYTETVVIENDFDHLYEVIDNPTTEINEAKPEKVAIYTDAEYVYCFAWCYTGERYVLEAKFDLAEGADKGKDHDHYALQYKVNGDKVDVLIYCEDCEYDNTLVNGVCYSYTLDLEDLVEIEKIEDAPCYDKDSKTVVCVTLDQVLYNADGEITEDYRSAKTFVVTYASLKDGKVYQVKGSVDLLQ